MTTREMDIEKYKILSEEAKEKVTNTLNLNVEPFNLRNYLKEARIHAEKHAKSLMPEHVIALEMSIKSILLLTKYVYEGPGNTQRNAFLAQLHRASNLLIASTELILSGLEETARVTSRSYFEAIDISLAILADKSFAEKFFGDEADYSKLWQTEIAYGKIYSYVRRALEMAELNDEADDFIAHRKNLKTILSGSVHCNESGAFRSWAVSPLGWPDMISESPHGVISFHAANHASALSSETYRFLSVILKCLMLGQLDKIHKLSSETDDANNFIAHFMAFQEIVHEYDLPEGKDILAEGHEPEEWWYS